MPLLCQEPVFASVYSSSTPQYVMCFNQVTVRAALWFAVSWYAVEGLVKVAVTFTDDV